MPISTVLGPLEPDRLGPTSMHEHLLLDARVWTAPSPEPLPDDPRVTPENLACARWNYLDFPDSLVSDEPAVLERLFRRIGPMLERYYGVGAADLERMLVGTPRRLLDRPPVH